MHTVHRLSALGMVSLAFATGGCASPTEDEPAEPTESSESALTAQKCDDGSIWMSHSLPCVEWTGGWPGGKVRGSAGIDYYSVKLQTCSAPGSHVCTGFIDVPGSTVVHQARTPLFAVSKFGMYRTCVKVASGGSWACMRTFYAPYLGD
jgi:hypothetical protein